jgi:putative ABC transport system substrate-binding protein
LPPSSVDFESLASSKARIWSLGGLLAYGPDYAAMFRRIGEFAARILNGAKAGDLPMEQPTMVELVINRGVAKALGLTIPSSVLLRANLILE